MEILATIHTLTFRPFYSADVEKETKGEKNKERKSNLRFSPSDDGDKQ